MSNVIQIVKHSVPARKFLIASIKWQDVQNRVTKPGFFLSLFILPKLPVKSIIDATESEILRYREYRGRVYPVGELA